MVCGDVDDVVAAVPGTGSAAVVVSAHYDSVPAGPGVGDDLSGVATLLEIARALRAGPTPRNTVILLFSDGEEEGLLGASAFLQASPLAPQVRAAFNLDSRLMRPPCLMFETGNGNLGLVRAFARSPRPSGASWITWVYQHLPNDTDFTVFRQIGLAGMNYACLGPLNLYHTPRDTFAAQDPAALQQVGAELLAMVRQTAGSDLATSQTSKNAVFTDLGQRLVLWWPQTWSWPLGLIGVLAVLLVVIGWHNRRDQRPRDLLWGLLGIVLMLALPTTVGGSLARFIGRLRGADWWAAHPLPNVLLWAVLAWWLGAAIAATVGRRCGAQALFVANSVVWSLAALALALGAPSLSVHLLLPVLAGVPSLLLMALSRRPANASLYLPPLVVAMFLCATDFLNAAAALSAGSGLALTALAAAAMSWLAPYYATVWRRAAPRRTEHVAALLILLIAFVGALALPAYDAQNPQRLNLWFVQRSGDAQGALLMGRFEGELGLGRALACEASEATRAICLTLNRPVNQQTAALRPWTGRIDRYAARVIADNAAPPQLAVLQDQSQGGARTLKLRLTSPRGADSLWLFLPRSARPVSATVDGQTMRWSRASAYAAGPQYSLGLFSPDAKGVDVEIKLASTAPVTATLLDIAYQLPPSLQPLAAARPAMAVPVQYGDTWSVYTTVHF